MKFTIDFQDGTPVYQQLMSQVKSAVATGRLRKGDRLPTIRELATSVRVNRNTIARVYADLEREGLVYMRPGTGTFVADHDLGLKEPERRTLLESDADWRVLISPTPIIGPDRVTKNDNQANPKGFWTEGQEFLDWVKDNKLDNLILMCGDRHWQYHAVDGRNGRQISEFSCGPTCDKHTASVPPIEEPYRGITRPYSASTGGFLTATYQPDGTLTCEFYDEFGELLNRHTFPKRGN